MIRRCGRAGSEAAKVGVSRALTLTDEASRANLIRAIDEFISQA
jgi:hypothetical protein